MTMQDFFPTPDNLIWKMLEGFKISNFNEILEPSAGKGDIADFIKKRIESDSRSRRNEQIDVIEIEKDLQHILKGKNHRLVHDDFLTFTTSKVYDLIIANFPFSSGEHHLQKALSMIDEHGGTLLCIVNAETIRNPYTQTRRWCVDKIKDLCGSVEFLEDQFKDAERKTGVSIALIKVSIENEETDSLIMAEMKKATEVICDDAQANQIVDMDFFKQIVSGYDMECKAGIKLIKEYFVLKPYILDRIVKPGQSDYSKPMLELKVKDENYSESLQSKTNKYLRCVRHKYWEVLINNPSFNNRFTSAMREELQKKLNDLQDYDFTLFNIHELEKELNAQINQGIEDAIFKLFEDLTVRYSYSNNPYEENVHYYNGWKSNKAYKIADKVILPMNGISSYSFSSKHRNIDNHYVQSKLTDMVKVFEILQGLDNSDAFRLVGNQIHYADQRQDYNLDLRYFELKFYKKGTCHIKFKNKLLLDKLNIYGSQRKAWLPPSYGKKAYEAMDSEEKQVIDEFQGKDEYNKVFNNVDFYLIAPTVLQLATTI